MNKAILILIICFSILLTATICYAAHSPKEREYQNTWCKQYNGIAEYKLKDNTRVDCVTTNYAIEFDFANKWAEAIGQSLYYGLMTNKKPAVVLIIEKPSDFRYYYRIEKVANFLHFKLWYVKSPNYKYKNPYKLKTTTNP